MKLKRFKQSGAWTIIEVVFVILIAGATLLWLGMVWALIHFVSKYW